MRVTSSIALGVPLLVFATFASLAASDTISKFEFQGFQNVFPLQDVVYKVTVVITTTQINLTFTFHLPHRLWTWAT